MNQMKESAVPESEEKHASHDATAIEVKENPFSLNDTVVTYVEPSFTESSTKTTPEKKVAVVEEAKASLEMKVEAEQKIKTMKSSKAPDTASEIDFFFFGNKKNWDWAAEIQWDTG